MARRARDTSTPDLFAVPRPASTRPGEMDYRAAIAHLTAGALKGATGDRFDVSAAMSRLTGHEVSRYMLDAYTSEARDTFNLPFWLVPALEVTCETHALSNWLADVRGARLLVGRESLTAELGKLERIKAEASRKIRELRRLMEATEAADGT